MSIRKIPTPLYLTGQLDGSQKTEIATYTAAQTYELGKIRLPFFLKNPSSEVIYLHLTDDIDSPTFTITSNPVYAEQVKSAFTGGANLFVWLSFDFNREWIFDEQVYYMYTTISNYTESNDCIIGFVYSYPDIGYFFKHA